MRQITGLNELREQGRMTWIEQEHGWVAAPEEIVKALSKEGFEECKGEMTTSRRHRRPAGGVWQGVEMRTGSVASAIWVNRPPWHQAIVAGGVWQGVNVRTGPVASAIWVNRRAWDQAIVFIAIDGESLQGAGARSPDPASLARRSVACLTDAAPTTFLERQLDWKKDGGLVRRLVGRAVSKSSPNSGSRWQSRRSISVAPTRS